MDIKQEKMQLTKLQSEDLEIIIVYRSDQGNTKELLQHLTNLVKNDAATVVCGDFNICYQTRRKKQDNSISGDKWILTTDERSYTYKGEAH